MTYLATGQDVLPDAVAAQAARVDGYDRYRMVWESSSGAGAQGNLSGPWPEATGIFITGSCVPGSTKCSPANDAEARSIFFRWLREHANVWEAALIGGGRVIQWWSQVHASRPSLPRASASAPVLIIAGRRVAYSAQFLTRAKNLGVPVIDLGTQLAPVIPGPGTGPKPPDISLGFPGGPGFAVPGIGPVPNWVVPLALAGAAFAAWRLLRRRGR